MQREMLSCNAGVVSYIVQPSYALGSFFIKKTFRKLLIENFRWRTNSHKTHSPHTPKSNNPATREMKDLEGYTIQYYFRGTW